MSVDKTRASRKFHIYDDFKLDLNKLRRKSSKDIKFSPDGAKKERRKAWMYSEPKVELRRYTSPKLDLGKMGGIEEENKAKQRRQRRNVQVYDDQSQFNARRARRATSPDASIQELQDLFPTMHVYDMEPYNLEGGYIYISYIQNWDGELVLDC